MGLFSYLDKFTLNLFGNNVFIGYNTTMIRTKHMSLDTSTPSELRFNDEVKRKASISVQNNSDTQSVYVGTSSVTTSNYGIILTPGQTLTMDLGSYDSIYAIGDSGATVTVLVIDK